MTSNFVIPEFEAYEHVVMQKKTPLNASEIAMDIKNLLRTVTAKAQNGDNSHVMWFANVCIRWMF